MKDNLFSFKDLSQDLQIGYWVILGNGQKVYIHDGDEEDDEDDMIL